MRRDILKWLHDALEACRAIQEFSCGHTLESYETNDMIRSAIERKFEIVAEALNKVRKEDPSFCERLPEVVNIIGMRNHITHGYDTVSHVVVWDAVQFHVPHLIRVLEQEM